MKTKESQLRASRNYRLRYPDKVKETCRRYAQNYYNDPVKKEIHKKKMLDYYYFLFFLLLKKKGRKDTKKFLEDRLFENVEAILEYKRVYRGSFPTEKLENEIPKN